MQRTRAIRLAVGAVAVAMLLPAVGASAADTDVTLTVTEADASALSISVDDGTVDLHATQSFEDTTVSGELLTTSVTDARGDLVGGDWTVQVDADGAFGGPGEAEIPLDGARVFMDAVDAGALTDALGGALNGMAVNAGTFVGDEDASLTEPYTLLSGSTVDLGLGEAPSITYTPSVEVVVPAGTVAGEYSVTVVQTVS